MPENFGIPSPCSTDRGTPNWVDKFLDTWSPIVTIASGSTPRVFLLVRLSQLSGTRIVFIPSLLNFIRNVFIHVSKPVVGSSITPNWLRSKLNPRANNPEEERRTNKGLVAAGGGNSAKSAPKGVAWANRRSSLENPIIAFVIEDTFFLCGQSL